MKMKDIRELSTDQLASQARELVREVGALREAVRDGKEKNNARIAQKRRDVARLKTALGERTTL